MKDVRLAAAGIILHQDKILLVRYKDNSKTFLVGPGGGVLLEEDLYNGLKREVFEETGINVTPIKMLFVEDLLSKKYRMIKVWFLCSVVNWVIAKTKEAEIEGIVDVNWYARSQLEFETVYPDILKNIDWSEFLDSSFEAKYIQLNRANF